MELVQGAALLHPEDAVFQGMLSGWARQQRARNLQQRTISEKANRVKDLFDFCGEYPWRWTAGHMDEWSEHLVVEQRLAESSIRQYQGAIRTFCDFLVSPHYRWVEECEKRFGTHPIQICHEWNTSAHLVDYEGDADRRPFTRKELQEFFDYCDLRVEKAARSGRKGALTAYRDATVFKTMYAWGLRRTEASKLDVVDWHRNPKAPELKNMGSLEVRWGKRTRGSPPRRRTVLTVMPWAVESVTDYLVNIRPRFGFPGQPALWLTERGGRLKPREINSRFEEYRDDLGLPEELVPHCLRHSYVTHLIEDGADPKFVQEQVGHRYASTLAIYTGVNGDFMNTMMRRVLDRNLREA
ncbi:tyrosine-type recombinase/integrase [Actinomadura luteofluorescens]|uniref:tyrosine-type recombinase/integrase n=1 Tax=Actinomadura luteofluorescens TaxID=46163 RepID=UPI002164A0FD|nr:tyrosine-type recombinase/integrase [Actinomadura glauciflava]